MTWGTNLLSFCNISLRNLTLQIGVGGEDKRTLTTLEAQGQNLSLVDIHLNHKDLDTLNHPILEQVWDWSINGTAPSVLSPTGNLGVYMPFGHPNGSGMMTRCAALDLDFFRTKNNGSYSEDERNAFLKKSQEFHAEEGIPFLWAVSRSHGVHQWYFFEEEIPIAEANKFVLKIRSIHHINNIYPLVEDSDLESKADPRPKVSSGDISATHRLLCPYSSWYPHSKFYLDFTEAPDDLVLPLVSRDTVTRYQPKAGATQSSAQPRTRTTEQTERPPISIDIPHITYRPSPEWGQVTLEQDQANRFKIPPFNSGLDISNLIPCATSIIANRQEIPEGQWWNFVFLMSQSLAALNTDDADMGLDQLTEVLNHIGSFGDYPPNTSEEFRITYTSALKEFHKGLPPACKKVGIARANCCPTRCYQVTGGYSAIQNKLINPNRPTIYTRKFTDPLVTRAKGPRYMSLCIPYYLKQEYKTVDLGDPDMWDDIFFEIHALDIVKWEKFWASVQSRGIRNIEKYNIELLMTATTKKDFSEYMVQLLGAAMQINDPYTFYRSDFLRLISKSISKAELTSKHLQPEVDHPVRIWFDDEGQRRIGLLHSTIKGIAVELIRRTGGIDSDKVVTHYMGEVLSGASLFSTAPNVYYWDINYPRNENLIALDHGCVDYLNASFDKIRQKATVTNILDRHLRQEKL